MKRRLFIKELAFTATLPFLPSLSVLGKTESAPRISGLTISGIKVYVVKVNQRGNWYFIELLTNKGLAGYGEASHAFSGSGAQYDAGDKALRSGIARFYDLINGQSPLNIAQFIERGGNRASKGKIQATAFSGIEQA